MDTRFAVKSKAPCALNLTARTIRYFRRQRSLAIYAAALCAVVLGGVKTTAQAAEPPAVVFIQPETEGAALVNTTGHIDLIWAVQPGSDQPVPAFELEGARSDDFAEPIDYYSGLDERTFLSGLAEGAYFFRVRALDTEARPGEWSEVLALEVKYVARWQVYLLMLIGLLCLTATVFIIIRGSFRTEGAALEDS